MQLRDPYIMLSRDGADRISRSTLTGGSLGLRYDPCEALYVVGVVESSKGLRFQVDIPREYSALHRGDQLKDSQWMRPTTRGINLQHLFLMNRPGVIIPFDKFRDMLPGVSDPGARYSVLVTHDPELAPEAVAAGAAEFAAWLIHRDGVQAIGIDIEPEIIGLTQLAGRWPIEQLATNSIMVVGCGSIGSAAAEALVGYGVGRIELVDPDRFLWHNMLRHTLGAESVGRHKVTALKSHLDRRWPSQTVVAHKLDVVDQAHYARPLIENVDLVLCTADGIAPRRVVSHLARRANKPAILACVLDQGAVGEIIRLRPSPRFGCLLCLRQHLSGHGAMDAEADQELDYGTGRVHQPMTAVPPDLRYMGILAGKVAVATVLESLHGDHTQRLPGEHAIIGLRPTGDLAAPFDLSKTGDVRWSQIPPPSASCPTCSPA